MLESEAAPLIRKNYRWNFTVNVLDGATFWFGMSFLSSAVILPLFVSHFTSSPVLIGLIAFLTAAPAWALIAFFTLYAWHCAGAGVIMVGWQDLIAKIIPSDRRGRFFGITNFIGNGTGVLGALALPLFLSMSDFRSAFTLAFGVAALCMLLSWGFLFMTREPAVESPLPASTWLDYLARLPSIVRQDGNFRRFLVSQSLTALSGMASGFLLVHAVRVGGLGDAQAGAFTVWLQAGLALANLGFGFLADKLGHRRGLEWGLLLNVASLLLAWLLAAPWAFSLVFFLRGAMGAAQFISGSALVYEFSAAEDRAVYLGLANTIPGLVAALAPLVGGFLTGLCGYPTMFALSAALAVAGWAVYRFGVRDPRGERMGTAGRG